MTATNDSRSLMKLFDRRAIEIFWRAQCLPSTLSVRETGLANHSLPRGAQRRINVYAVVRHELARMAWPRSTHYHPCGHHGQQTQGNATRGSHPTDGSGTTRSLGARHHLGRPRVSRTLRRLTHDRFKRQKEDGMAVTFQRNVGLLLLAVWLILYGLAGMIAFVLPAPLMAVLALLAGILILVGR